MKAPYGSTILSRKLKENFKKKNVSNSSQSHSFTVMLPGSMNTEISMVLNGLLYRCRLSQLWLYLSSSL